MLKQAEKTDDTPNCSLTEALTKQDLYINGSLAQMGCSILWNLFREGSTRYRSFFFNLKEFRLQPIPIGWRLLWAAKKNRRFSDRKSAIPFFKIGANLAGPFRHYTNRYQKNEPSPSTLTSKVKHTSTIEPAFIFLKEWDCNLWVFSLETYSPFLFHTTLFIDFFQPHCEFVLYVV